MAEGKQAQRVLVKGNRIIGIEQVQTVVVHEAETWQDHIEDLYHQCKLQEMPVLPTVTKELVGIAARDCETYSDAARVLGVSYRTVRHILNKGKLGDYLRLKTLMGEEDK